MTAAPSATETARGLREAWALRNSAADTLVRAEVHAQQIIQAASLDDLIALIESFSPGRSPGVEWTRSFEALAERLWFWLPEETIGALEENFRARGIPWMAVANAFTPERGAELRERIRQPAWARYPAFTIE